MSDITHYNGCWHERKHHACAVREIDRLHEELLSRHAEIRRQAEEIERLRGLLQVCMDKWVPAVSTFSFTEGTLHLNEGAFRRRVKEALSFDEDGVPK